MTHEPPFHSLSSRLLLSVAAGSVLFALVSALVQLIIQYRLELKRIDAVHHLIEKSHAPSIAASLYAVNEDQVAFLVKGLLNFPEIQYAEVRETTAERRFVCSEGDPESRAGRVSVFPLAIDMPGPGTLHLGTLTVASRYQDIYRKLWRNVGVLLLSTFFQTLLVSVLVLFMVERLATRRLVHMAAYAGGLRADRLNEPLIPERTGWPFQCPDELDQKLGRIGSVTKARVMAFSNVSGIGFDAFQQALLPGNTYCLLGSSGVGKTTIINRLIGRQAFDTKAVSVTGEGTHTTSRRQLIVLSQGAMLIDTPGMRELGLVGAGDGVNAGFEQIVRLAETCRYANCSHEHEPGCAVRAAIKNGELSEDRYSSYRKLKQESDFHEMAYLEKRKKDKAVGRFVKTVKKQLKN